MFRCMRWVVVMAIVGVSAASYGCSTGCDDETVSRAVAFLEMNQACAVDADCVVVSDFCEELPSGYCGQLTMNRSGAESAEWKALSDELDECAPSKCTVCDAALVPSCRAGSCGGA